jgi:transcriptional regulator with XRE-family HTH domain
MVGVDKQVYQRIVEARHTLNLSQEQFADGIKISRAHIGAIETGTRRVNDRIIKLITMTFGVNEVWLKTGDGAMFDKADDFRLQQVVSSFKKLDPSFQNYVIKHLDLLLELQGEEAGSAAVSP